jgi:nucleoside-diphosphate-sugar epimerase
MKQVLVTGGTGFLGRSLVRTLLDLGHPVRVLARPGVYRDSARVREALADMGAELACGDLLDRPALRSALQGVEAIYHLAGRLYIWGVPRQEYLNLHIDGVRGLLEACRETGGIRSIVHVSSTGVLGPTGPVPLAEDAPLNPSNIYEASKAAGEALALELAPRYGLPLAVARPALAYGPGDLHLLSWFRMIQKGLYRLVGPGDNLLHPIYVDDVATGLIKIAGSPAATGRIYHLASEQAVTMRELAGEIARALSRRLPQPGLPRPLALGIAAVLERLPGLPPERLPLTRSRVRFMTQSRVYSGERARVELGFIPQVDLETGLNRTVAWYRQEGLL